jgi:hypothetical protein
VLRRGTVPANGLDLLAVGLNRLTPALDAELDTAAGGGSAFKAVRGKYGAGKTFLTRYLAERALRRGFAATEVQVSETQTRRLCPTSPIGSASTTPASGLRRDLTRERWQAATADAGNRLRLPDVDDRALAGLKFTEALPHRLASRPCRPARRPGQCRHSPRRAPPLPQRPLSAASGTVRVRRS